MPKDWFAHQHPNRTPSTSNPLETYNGYYLPPFDPIDRYFVLAMDALGYPFYEGIIKVIDTSHISKSSRIDIYVYAKIEGGLTIEQVHKVFDFTLEWKGVEIFKYSFKIVGAEIPYEIAKQYLPDIPEYTGTHPPRRKE